MSTILITGAAGFLGRHVAREFSQTGGKVVGVDVVAAENSGLGPNVEYARLTLPSPAFGELLQRTQPAALIHCAGRASVANSLTDPGADFRDGTVLTFEVLDALRRVTPADSAARSYLAEFMATHDAMEQALEIWRRLPAEDQTS